MDQSEIRFMTEDQFMSFFRSPNIKPSEMQMTENELRRKLLVNYSCPQTLDELFDLDFKPAKGRKIIKSIEDYRWIHQDDIVHYYHQVLIVGRERYLRNFYQAYFAFKAPDKLDWSPDRDLTVMIKTGVDDSGEPVKEPAISYQRNDSSRRIIRNLFALELLDEVRVTNSVKSHISFWSSLIALFNDFKLEDRFFAPTCIKKCLKPKQLKSGTEINYNVLFYLFQQYQPKASILNPYTITWWLNNLVKRGKKWNNIKMFSPVLSWGSNLLAAFNVPGISEYCGIDVIPSVCSKCNFLADYCRELTGNKLLTNIVCCPSEKIETEHPSIVTGEFDIGIVCPPYYTMEEYPGAMQSTKTYSTYSSWLEGYWKPTVKLCYNMLKPNGYMLVILNDYYTLKKKHYPLTTDMISMMDGFTLDSEHYVINRVSPMRINSKDRTERLFIFYKSSSNVCIKPVKPMVKPTIKPVIKTMIKPTTKPMFNLLKPVAPTQRIKLKLRF